MANYPTTTHKYTFLWGKYRPAILKHMVDASKGKGPQSYRLSNHEFKDVNPKEKGGHTFTMCVHQGKAINNIKASIVAMDLLITLQKSKKATELTDHSTFEFVLDKQYVLHIKHEETEEEVIEEESTQEEATEAGVVSEILDKVAEDKIEIEIKEEKPIEKS